MKSERLENQRARKREWDAICPRLLALPAGHERSAAVQALAEKMQGAGRKGFSLQTIYRQMEVYRTQGCSHLPYSHLFRNKQELLEIYDLTAEMVRGWLKAKGKNGAGWCVAHGYRKNALSDLLAGRRGTGEVLDEMVGRLTEEMQKDRPAWKRKLSDLRHKLLCTQKEIAKVQRALGEVDLSSPS